MKYKRSIWIFVFVLLVGIVNAATYNFYLQDINSAPVTNYSLIVTNLDNSTTSTHNLIYSTPTNYTFSGSKTINSGSGDDVIIQTILNNTNGTYIPNFIIDFYADAGDTILVYVNYTYIDGTFGLSNILNVASTTKTNRTLTGSDISKAVKNASIYVNGGSSHNVNLRGIWVRNMLPVNNFSVSTNTNYNFYINKTNYSFFNTSILTNTTTTQGNIYTIHPYNEILFYTYNEIGGALITNATTITLSNYQNSYSGTTINGSLRISSINTGNYSLTTNSTIYTVRTGYVFVDEGSTQTYNIYLANSTAILLNFRAVGGAAIPGVYVNIQSFVNNQLVTIEQGYSGVDGTLQFGGLNNRYYLINVSKDGYAPYTFELNPVLYTSYTIPMTALISGTVTPTGYAVWSPNTFRKGSQTDFQIQFFSPYSSFTNYSYTLTYPNGNITNNGNQVNGETFTNTFTISNGTRNDYVRLNVTWYLDDNTSQSNTYNYPLIVALTNRTIMSGGDKDYGFEIGDKVFLVAIVLLPLMGLAFLAFGFFGSLAVGGITLTIMLNSGLFTATETQLYIASGVLIVLLLIFRGRQ